MVIDSALAKKTLALTNLVEEFQHSANAQKIRELGALLKKLLTAFRATLCKFQLNKCHDIAVDILDTMGELDSAEYTARAYRSAQQVSHFLFRMSMGYELPSVY